MALWVRNLAHFPPSGCGVSPHSHLGAVALLSPNGSRETTCILAIDWLGFPGQQVRAAGLRQRVEGGGRLVRKRRFESVLNRVSAKESYTVA